MVTPERASVFGEQYCELFPAYTFSDSNYLYAVAWSPCFLTLWEARWPLASSLASPREPPGDPEVQSWQPNTGETFESMAVAPLVINTGEDPIGVIVLVGYSYTLRFYTVWTHEDPVPGWTDNHAISSDASPSFFTVTPLVWPSTSPYSLQSGFFYGTSNADWGFLGGGDYQLLYAQYPDAASSIKLPVFEFGTAGDPSHVDAQSFDSKYIVIAYIPYSHTLWCCEGDAGKYDYSISTPFFTIASDLSVKDIVIYDLYSFVTCEKSSIMNINFYTHDSSGNWVSVQNIDYQQGGSCSLDVGDVDNNGVPDIVMFNGTQFFRYELHDTTWVKFTMSPPFSTVQQQAISVVDTPRVPNPAYLDIVSSYWNTMTGAVYYFHSYDPVCSTYNSNPTYCTMIDCEMCLDRPLPLCSTIPCQECETFFDETTCQENFCTWCTSTHSCVLDFCTPCRNIPVESCSLPCVICNTTETLACMDEDDMCLLCPQSLHVEGCNEDCQWCNVSSAHQGCIPVYSECANCSGYTQSGDCNLNDQCMWCTFTQTCEWSPADIDNCSCEAVKSSDTCQSSPFCLWQSESTHCSTTCQQDAVNDTDIFFSSIVQLTTWYQSSIVKIAIHDEYIYAILYVDSSYKVAKISSSGVMCSEPFPAKYLELHSISVDPYNNLFYIVGTGSGVRIKATTLPYDVGIGYKRLSNDCIIASFSMSDCSLYWSTPWGYESDNEVFYDIKVDESRIVIAGSVSSNFPLPESVRSFCQSSTSQSGIILSYYLNWTIADCHFAGTSFSHVGISGIDAVALGTSQSSIAVARLFADSSNWVYHEIPAPEGLSLKPSGLSLLEYQDDLWVAAIISITTSNQTKPKIAFFQFYSNNITLYSQDIDTTDNVTITEIVPHPTLPFLVSSGFTSTSTNATLPFLAVIPPPFYNSSGAHGLFPNLYIFGPVYGTTQFSSLGFNKDFLFVAGFTTTDFISTSGVSHVGSAQNQNALLFKSLLQDTDDICVPTLPTPATNLSVTPLFPLANFSSVIEVAWPTFELLWKPAYFGYVTGYYVLNFSWVNATGLRTTLSISLSQTLTAAKTDLPFSFEPTSVRCDLYSVVPYVPIQSTNFQFSYRVVPMTMPSNLLASTYAQVSSNSLLSGPDKMGVRILYSHVTNASVSLLTNHCLIDVGQDWLVLKYAASSIADFKTVIPKVLVFSRDGHWQQWQAKDLNFFMNLSWMELGLPLWVLLQSESRSCSVSASLSDSVSSSFSNSLSRSSSLSGSSSLSESVSLSGSTSFSSSQSQSDSTLSTSASDSTTSESWSSSQSSSSVVTPLLIHLRGTSSSSSSHSDSFSYGYSDASSSESTNLYSSTSNSFSSLSSSFTSSPSLSTSMSTSASASSSTSIRDWCEFEDEVWCVTSNGPIDLQQVVQIELYFMCSESFSVKLVNLTSKKQYSYPIDWFPSYSSSNSISSSSESFSSSSNSVSDSSSVSESSSSHSESSSSVSQPMSSTEPFPSTDSSSQGKKHNSLGSKIAAIVIPILLIALCVVIVFGFILWRIYKNKPEEAITTSFQYGFELQARNTFDPGESILLSENNFVLSVPSKPITMGFDTNLAPIDRQIESQFTILNDRSEKKYTWKLFPPLNPKYTLKFEPNTGTLNSGEQIDVSIYLTVYCTTVLHIEIPLGVCAGSTWEKCENHALITISLSTEASVKLDPDEITLTQPPIGDGSYGTVFRAEWHGQEVAVKLLKNQRISSAETTAFENEISAMNKLKSPYVVNFVGACLIPGNLAIVTELCEYGSFTSAMAKNKFSVPFKVKCLTDCAKGMHHIHSAGMLHRDLKPDNLLVVCLDADAPVCCKISDLGTARGINRSQATQYYTKGVGTPAYMAPEILENDKYSTAADVYSYSLVVWVAMAETLPFGEPEFASQWKIAEFIIAGKRLAIPEGTPEFIGTLMTNCWAVDPHERPSFKEICKYLAAQSKLE
ncbi:protein serine/threonine kinase [Pelomyxa schiedti]|nr:protein serine/threonine kinase [Pelomyxa schiedti]